MSKELYYEDFTSGQQFKSSGTYTVTKESALDFAHEYDPQLQHIDEKGAQGSLHKELIISGWQTAAATMRLKIQTELANVAGGLLGVGIEHLKWPRPTYPGDTLNVVITILDKRLSRTRPDRGIVRYRVETFNQRGEIAMEMSTAVIVPIRNTAQQAV